MPPQPIDIFKEIKALGFPSNQFIVVGSGVMAAKGIREAHDLDIVATKGLFDACLKSGWELRPWTKLGLEGTGWLKKGSVDIHLYISHKCERLSFKDLMKKAEVINGSNFIGLEQLVEFKKEYGQEKDFRDIELIHAYLEANASGA